MKLIKYTVIFILMTFLVMTILLIIPNRSKEEKDFTPDVYKKYTIVDKNLSYTEAGDVFGYITIPESKTDFESYLYFKKIKDVPVNEFVAGKKVARTPPPVVIHYNVYFSPANIINPLNDWTVNSLNIYKPTDINFQRPDPDKITLDVLFSTTDNLLLKDFIQSAKHLTTEVPYNASGRLIANIMLTFKEYPSIFWSAVLYKYDNYYVIQTIEPGAMDSEDNTQSDHFIYSRLSNELCEYINSLYLD